MCGKPLRGNVRKALANDKVRVYGVEILWPVILVQVGVLRHAMGFTPTNKAYQAAVFDLEHVIESAAGGCAEGRS